MIKINIFSRRRQKKVESDDFNTEMSELLHGNTRYRIDAEIFNTWMHDQDCLRTDIVIWSDGGQDWYYFTPELEMKVFRILNINGKLELDGEV
jgi:hypothetical protein